MTAWRAFFRTRPALALLLIAAALAMKALVPAGFMVGTQGKSITVEICADTFGVHLAKPMTMPMPGKHGGTGSDHAKAAASCPFGGLAMAALGGADPVLPGAAIAFILATGLAAPRAFATTAPPRLRPPLRAPPIGA